MLQLFVGACLSVLFPAKPEQFDRPSTNGAASDPRAADAQKFDLPNVRPPSRIFRHHGSNFRSAPPSHRSAGARCSHSRWRRGCRPILRALARYVEAGQFDGSLTREMAINFIFSWEETANGRAFHYGIVRRFSEYLAIYDAPTEALEPRELPRSRAIPPPRILSDEELGSLISTTSRVSPRYPQRGLTLTTLVGLLVSTGLRCGEALRLDRADADLADGVLHIRKTKFRKDRLVSVHITMLASLRTYARHRDAAFPTPKDSAFFLSSRATGGSFRGVRCSLQTRRSRQ